MQSQLQEYRIYRTSKAPKEQLRQPEEIVWLSGLVQRTW